MRTGSDTTKWNLPGSILGTSAASSTGGAVVTEATVVAAAAAAADAAADALKGVAPDEPAGFDDDVNPSNDGELPSTTCASAAVKVVPVLGIFRLKVVMLESNRR